MELVVDGVIYQFQSKGGISRYFSEILPRMCAMDDSLRITLMTQGPLKQVLPVHPRIWHHSIPWAERFLRPGRVWKPVLPLANRFMRQMWSGRGRGKIWHSTYYTMPGKWIGDSVVTVVDMIHELFQELVSGSPNDQLREEKRRCLEEAGAIICISESTRHDLQSYYGTNSDAIRVIHLASSSEFRQIDQAEADWKMPFRQPYLLYVGSRTHYKNFDILIQAYSMWSKKEDVVLVVVGRPWIDDEIRRLAELKIQERVHLLIEIEDEELCRVYNMAAAFVYPSLYEGFGIPLLEAMTCGCPIIASRIPSTIEVAKKCPIYFEPTEVADLVTAFETALSEGRNSERVREGLKLVKDFSWDKTATQTLELYRTIS